MFKVQKIILFTGLLLNLVLCKTVYAFNITASTNNVRLSQTATVTVNVSPGAPGDYTYEWSTDKGNVSPVNNVATFTAPATKGKATISVTVKSGGSPVYTGSVKIYVYKSIIIIKCDDYWTDVNGLLPGKWKDYTDYMVSTQAKCCLGVSTQWLETCQNSFITATQNYKNSGYIEFYCHGYAHEVFSDYTAQQQLDLLTTSENLARTKLGFPLVGFGAPQNINNSDTTWAMNNVPEMKYWFFYDMVNSPPPFNGINFSMNGTRLNAESSAQHIDYNWFLSEYASKISNPVNVIQIHPPWWVNDGTGGYHDLDQWKQVIAYLRAGGVTIITALDYANMVTDPAFIPDEILVTDNTPPGPPAAVRDGTGTIDAASTDSTTQLSANWDAATDAESGISSYQYAIGTTAGASNITNWTDNGTALAVTKTGTYTAGLTYYFTVRARSAGGTGPAANSNGQLVSSGGDTTPPGAPAAVRDGTGADINFTNSTTELSANWDTSADSESGISRYYFAIGSSPGATNITNWTALGNVLAVTKTGLSLTVNQIYYFSVKAESAGGTGPVRNSNGQTVTEGPIPDTPPIYPNPYSLSRPGGMKFKVSDTSESEIKIFTTSGKLVRKLTGTNTVSWDGTNEDNEKVARGIYICQIIDSNGNRTEGKIAVTR